MRLSSKTKYEKLEAKKQALNKKLDGLQTQATDLQSQAREALLNDVDPDKLLQQKAAIDLEIQTVRGSLQLTNEAMAESEAEHIKIKLAEIKKETARINSEVEPLQKKYEEAKKAYQKAEAALSTAHYKALDRWQRLSKMGTELKHRLLVIEPQADPETNEPLTAPAKLVARW